MSNGPKRYVPLLESFLSGQVDAATFQHRFLESWREDRDAGVATGDVIDKLMTAVDCYDENPDVLTRIDAAQLRTETAEALHFLSDR